MKFLGFFFEITIFSLKIARLLHFEVERVRDYLVRVNINVVVCGIFCIETQVT